jgi:hypothetical protein
MTRKVGRLKNNLLLVRGYYFWEDNMDAAEWWGHRRYLRYNESCRIFRIKINNLNYQDGVFLYLVGNVEHIKFLRNMINILSKRINTKDWKLHQYIYSFREIGKFPFRIIRFLDYSTQERKGQVVKLNDGSVLTPY